MAVCAVNCNYLHAHLKNIILNLCITTSRTNISRYGQPTKYLHRILIEEEKLSFRHQVTVKKYEKKIHHRFSFTLHLYDSGSVYKGFERFFVSLILQNI